MPSIFYPANVSILTESHTVENELSEKTCLPDPTDPGKKKDLEAQAEGKCPPIIAYMPTLRDKI
jgi:hypothetical protein